MCVTTGPLSSSWSFRKSKEPLPCFSLSCTVRVGGSSTLRRGRKRRCSAFCGEVSFFERVFWSIGIDAFGLDGAPVFDEKTKNLLNGETSLRLAVAKEIVKFRGTIGGAVAPQLL